MNIKKLDYREPAVLRGIALAALALAGSLGVVIPEDLPGRIDVLIVGGATFFPLVQAVWTRFAVWSPKAKDAAVAAAARPLGSPQIPGVGDHREGAV